MAAQREGQALSRQAPVRVEQRYGGSTSYQAVLLEENQILLSTHDATEDLRVLQIDIPNLPMGTIWDYTDRARGRLWRAMQTETTAGQALQMLHQVGNDHWIGKTYTVINPASEHITGFTSEEHRVFLNLHVGQLVTAISPPVFIWASTRRLTGAWCTIATTYHGDTTQYMVMTHRVQTGAVPLAALDW